MCTHIKAATQVLCRIVALKHCAKFWDKVLLWKSYRPPLCRTRLVDCFCTTEKQEENWRKNRLFTENALAEHEKLVFYFIFYVKKLAPKGVTAQNINFSIKDFFCKCYQILRIWSDLLKKSLMENLIFFQRVGRGRVPKTYVLKKPRNLGKVEFMKHLRKYETSLS